jgi:hypothetical protein
MHMDPGSQDTLRIASRWLDNCVNNHNNCSRPVFGGHMLPKRVLNVGDDTRDPFLVEFAGNGRPGSWAALSYCWGSASSLKLTRENISTLKKRVCVNKVGATIRDAIYVTRALGLTYLWIDALCISQDDDKQDWNEQSSKMNAIYAESTVTIVAENSSSVAQGFLVKRKLQYAGLDWYLSQLNFKEHLDDVAAQRVYIAPSWDPKDDQITGPWAARGWTMQEELLPDRLLYYTSTQIIWRCCAVTEYERGIIQEPQKEIVRSMSGEGGKEIWDFDTFSKFKTLPFYLQLNLDIPVFEKYQLWYELIEAYSPRQFTCIQDRLVAISGLAKQFGSIIKDDQYVAGLWKRDLLRGLLWHVRGTKLILSKKNGWQSGPRNSVLVVGKCCQRTNSQRSRKTGWTPLFRSR